MDDEPDPPELAAKPLPIAEVDRPRSEDRYGSETSADHQAIEQLLPEYPPFTCFLGNLAHRATEDDIFQAFRDLRVKDIRIQLDRETGRSKGFAYVDFEDRESLAKVFQYSGELIAERPIKIDLPNDRYKGGRGGYGGGYGHRDEGRRYQHDRGDSYRSRDRDDARYNKDDRYAREDRYDRFQRDDRRDDRSYNRDDRYSRDDRRDDRSFERRDSRTHDRGEARGYERTEPRNFERSERRPFDSRPKDDAVDSAPNSASTPSERPKLKLIPRKSITKEPQAGPVSRPASIFGLGRPHDEVEYEKKKAVEVQRRKSQDNIAEEPAPVEEHKEIKKEPVKPASPKPTTPKTNPAEKEEKTFGPRGGDRKPSTRPPAAPKASGTSPDNGSGPGSGRVGYKRGAGGAERQEKRPFSKNFARTSSNASDTTGKPRNEDSREGKSQGRKGQDREGAGRQPRPSKPNTTPKNKDKDSFTTVPPRKGEGRFTNPPAQQAPAEKDTGDAKPMVINAFSALNVDSDSD